VLACAYTTAPLIETKMAKA